MDRVVSHQIKLPKAPPNLALNASRDRTSVTSLGIFASLTPPALHQQLSFSREESSMPPGGFKVTVHCFFSIGLPGLIWV